MPFVDPQGQVVDAPEYTVVEIETFDQSTVPEDSALGLPFEGGADGRAFSVAALLRAEGYRGTLVGTGEIGIDRLAYGFRTGFDLLWLAPEELELLGEQHLAPFPSHYQLASGQS